MPPAPDAAIAAVKNSHTRFLVSPTPLMNMAFSLSVASATGVTEVGRGEKHEEKVHFPAHPAMPDAWIGQSNDRPRLRTASGQDVNPWLK
jgi:hypothetical protein